MSKKKKRKYIWFLIRFYPGKKPFRTILPFYMKARTFGQIRHALKSIPEASVLSMESHMKPPLFSHRTDLETEEYSKWQK